MISVFLREQRRYTLTDLTVKFCCPEEKTVRILKRLKEYGAVKMVRAGEVQRDPAELAYGDADTADFDAADSQHSCVFTFVGVIAVEGLVLKCCPKYLPDSASPEEAAEELKLVLKVLRKYSSQEQIIKMYSGTGDFSTVSLLSVMLFLLQDYFEYGAYTSTQDVIESCGSGEILWDRTISSTFTCLVSGTPYYLEPLTRNRVSDDFNYFRRLHECILTRCTEELDKAGLLDLFETAGACISEEQIEDFGDREYILDRIDRELHVQFSTRKQLLLNAMHAYIASMVPLDDAACLTMYGTGSFNLVWEKICGEVLDNQLQKRICNLNLPVPLAEKYSKRRQDKLVELIDQPQWVGKSPDGSFLAKQTGETLRPDIVTITGTGECCQFTIFDAKYYCIQLEPGREPRGQPGIESVTKQYLYQLAFQEFVQLHGITRVANCFLFPVYGEADDAAVDKGHVSLQMLSGLGLQDIQLRLLPARCVYRHYLSGSKIDIAWLHLQSDPSADGTCEPAASP